MHLRSSVHYFECTRDVHKPLRQRKLKGTWKRYILHDMHITFISRNEYFFAMICTFVEHVNCFFYKTHVFNFVYLYTEPIQCMCLPQVFFFLERHSYNHKHKQSKQMSIKNHVCSLNEIIK